MYIRRVQPTRCNVSQFICFCRALYMFQTVFPSIIRSSKLHTHRQVLVWQIPDAVCAVLSSWWWTEKLSETCRASYRNKYIVKRCISLVVVWEYIISSYFLEGTVTKIPPKINCDVVSGAQPTSVSQAHPCSKFSTYHITFISIATRWSFREAQVASELFKTKASTKNFSPKKNGPRKPEMS